MSGIMNKLHLKGHPDQNQGLYQQQSQGSLQSSGGFGNQGLGYDNVGSGYTMNSAEANPIQERTVVGAPIVQEHIRNDRVVEVQPVIHRNVDQSVVNHIEKHFHEPAAPSMSGAVYEMNPLVQQTAHTNIFNEIQPIIHRERVVQTSDLIESHRMERIAEPTIHTHEVVHEQSSTSYEQGYGQTNTTAKHGFFHRH